MKFTENHVPRNGLDITSLMATLANVSGNQSEREAWITRMMSGIVYIANHHPAPTPDVLN